MRQVLGFVSTKRNSIPITDALRLKKEKTMMLLATDLDGTFLGGSISKKRKLYRLIRS